MALFLVVHTSKEEDDVGIRPPTRMLDLAREAGAQDASPRWMSTLTPDLHDDRIFTLWDAESGDEILTALERYEFLNHMSAQPLRVQQWGPAEVIAAEGADD